MNAPAQIKLSRRAVVQGGALTVGFALAGFATNASAQPARIAGPAARVVDPGQVDSYLTLNADGTATLFTGKVDLGQGLRIALRQMCAEELGIAPARIKYVEGDTALCPDQGRTAGSNGIQRGGVQIRQAAATARQALIEIAAKHLGHKPEDLMAADGQVRPRLGGEGIAYARLLDGKQFNLRLDPKAPLKKPQDFVYIGKPLSRPDVPAKCTGSHIFVHDFTLPNMLHARVVRPPAIGARLNAVDEGSIKDIPGAKTVRIENFLAVVAEDEWNCVRALRALKTQWSEWAGLPEQSALIETLRAASASQEVIENRGERLAQLPVGGRTLAASYFWPLQSHGSIGPSCAVADVRADGATIWTASQATHAYWPHFARTLGLPKERVRVVYLDGAGCYGMNGHEDAAVEAALLSKSVGRPVRVQWMREDEHGWDPKGPAQLLDIAGAIDAEGRILEWRTQMWVPQATKGLANTPLLAPAAAGIPQPHGIATGLITQNGGPPYAADHVNVAVHWLKDPILRPSNIRAPGKVANSFAVESFFDELAAAGGFDPVDLRLRWLKDPRGIEVIKRVAARMNWQTRPSPGPDAGAAGAGIAGAVGDAGAKRAGGAAGAVARGRGFSYVHYKHNETYVAMAVELEIERASGRVNVERIVCAHDCGMIVNPDGVRAQVEGCILQTLSRTLMEEVKFDRARVTSTDWASYPILTFSQAPKLDIELIDRASERPLGAGEAAAPPLPAAVGNAVFDALGVRLRLVPFTPQRIRSALAPDT
jgi:CO/xanthine dehydrogenase Mo-binding subunit